MAAEPLRVRPGSAADLETIAEIERQAAISPWSLSQFVSISLRDENDSLVLESAGGALIGFAIFQQVLDESTLLNIAIRRKLQGRGHGAFLLEALLDTLRSRGAKRCMLEVRMGNEAALALYRCHGFIDDGVRKDYYPSAEGRGTEDALLMSCELGTSQ